MFNVAIIGGENTGNYELFKQKCIYFLQNKAKSGGGITIFSIGDSYVDQFAKRYGINVKIFYTNWKTDKKNALKNRNIELLKNCNGLILFDNEIKDENIIYNMAKERNIPSKIVNL